jgi:hypothetical protein
MARELGQSTYTGRIGAPASPAPAMDDDRLLQVTRGVHGQIPTTSSPQDAAQHTVADEVAANPALAAVLSVPFRRTASPAGPVARRLTTAPLPPPVTGVGGGAITPVPVLTPVTGMQDLTGLTQAGASAETLQKLDPGRVAVLRLPWEQGSAAPTATAGSGPGDVLIQPGYLSDLWVVGTSLGRALDWDGTALLGWTDPPVIPDAGSPLAETFAIGPPPVIPYTPGPAIASGGTPTGFYSPPSPYGGAACLINWNKPGISPDPALAVVQAFARVEAISGSGANTVWGYTIAVGWALRGDAIPGVQNSPVKQLTVNKGIAGTWTVWPGIGPYAVSGPDETGSVPAVTTAPAICAGDLTGSGNPSLAVVWSGDVRGVLIYVFVDVGVDGSAGPPIRPVILDAAGEVQGAALANGRLFILAGGQLMSTTVNLAAGTIEQPFTTHAWWAQNVPPDCAWATIATADFTGSRSADLLCFYAIAVPGSEGSTAYRASYRIAYKPDATGEPAYVGDEVGAPIPVTGVPASVVVLPPVDPETVALRQTTSRAFRAAAQVTQSRLTNVIPAAVDPPPPPVPVAALADTVRAALDPQSTVPKSVTERLALPGALDQAGGDVLQPLAFTPYFPQPFYETVRDNALPWLIPGLSAFPDEAITVLGADSPAVEAILAGANHELSRELLWRGVPALHTATFFARFWDRRDAAGKPLPDITDIATWGADTDLGSHSPPGAPGELVVLLLRGELVRRFPHATMYAAPAVQVQTPAGTISRTIDLSQRIDPIFSGTLGGDSAFAGFPFTIQAAHSSPGMYFVFQEHPTATRFGINLAPGNPASYGVPPAAWSLLDWSGTVPDQAHYAALTYLDTSQQTSPLWGISLPDADAHGAATHRWGVSAAHMAHITYRPPVLIAIHADELLA